MKKIWGADHMYKNVISAVGFTGAMFLGASLNPAFSADLGGDCCADLEERVAVLEATTARKGNRKVSLTISGWTSSQLYVWDDGDLSDAYVTDNSPDLSTRLTFAGSAKINSDWSAGYAISISLGSGDSLQTNQLSDDAGAGVFLENSYMWVKNEKLGKLSWGLQSQASDNASLLQADLSGTVFPANHVMFDAGFMRLRPKGGPGGLAGINTTASNLDGTLGAFGYCVGTGAGFGAECSGDRTNSIRYDTPSIGGLVLSASWGEDDFWDVAFQWSGKFDQFKLAAGGSYSEVTGGGDGRFGGGFTGLNSEYVHVGGTILHEPTGLFVYGSYGHEESSTTGLPDSDHWTVKPGVKVSLTSLGKTVFYGEYTRYSDAYGAFPTGSGDFCGAFDGITGTNADAACASAADTTVNVTGSELNRYGFGIVQNIDAASMMLWAKWRHHELDVDFNDNGVAGKQEFEDIDVFLAGGVIFF